MCIAHHFFYDVSSLIIIIDPCLYMKLLLVSMVFQLKLLCESFLLYVAMRVQEPEPAFTADSINEKHTWLTPMMIDQPTKFHQQFAASEVFRHKKL